MKEQIFKVVKKVVVKVCALYIGAYILTRTFALLNCSLTSTFISCISGNYINQHFNQDCKKTGVFEKCCSMAF